MLILNKKHPQNKATFGTYIPYTNLVCICKKKCKENMIWKQERNIYSKNHFYPFMRGKMKKFISISILSFLIVWLMWCSTKKPQETTNTATNSCKEAISAYLDQTQKSTKWKIVEKWNTVTVDYIGRLDKETVFDTSIELVAKACGKYTAGRNYNEGLSFEVGAGQMIAGFDKAVEWMNIGQTKTIHIEASEAYGERSEKNLVKVPREQIPENEKLEKWMKLMASNGQPFTVYELSDKEVTLDANHDLAGKTLIFDITIKNIQK